jgi:hypothetical protein
MKRFTPLLLAVLLLHAGVLVTPASACPGCKDSVGSDDAAVTAGGGDPTTPSGLPGGFNTSVYLMLGGLFGTMSLVGWVVVKGIRTPSVRPGGFPVEKRPTEGNDEENPKE